VYEQQSIFNVSFSVSPHLELASNASSKNYSAWVSIPDGSEI